MQEINIKDQVEFISGMQGRFNIFELFNVFDLKKMIKENLILSPSKLSKNI